MAQYDELTRLLRELLTNRFSPKPRYVRGVLGDGLGNVVVPDRPDKSYARFSKNSTTYFEIFNRTVNPVNNWPILIGELPWQPGLTQVVDTDWSAFEQAGWGDTLGNTSPHAPTHEWPDGSPGSDAVDVHLRAIVPGRAFISDTAPTVIYVNSFEYGTTGTLWAGLPGVDLQPMMSATVTGTMRYAGVYVDESTNSLGIVTGGTTVYTSALEPPRVSFPETGVIPIARVRVYGGQASIAEADIKDARRLWDSGGGVTFNDSEGDPADVAPTAADGTSGYAARRDHIHEIDITGFDAETTADDADLILIYDDTATAHRKMTRANLFSGSFAFAILNRTTGVKYTSLPTAISAASSGDVIELGDDLSETAVIVNKAIILRGLTPGITLTITGDNNGLNPTAAGFRIENLRVVNSTTGTTSRAIRCDESGTLDNVIAVCSGGNTRYGVYVAASKTVNLIDCDVSASGGSSTDAGLVVDGTVNVYNGRYAGDDYSLLVGSGTANLYGPHFANVVFNSAGTINGSYIDASGDLVQPGNEDVYPTGDNYGIFNRLVNYGFTPDEHWSRNTDDIAWTGWAAYTGTGGGISFGTPGIITTTNSIYRVANAGAIRAFRYRAAATGAAIAIRSRLSISYLCSAGLQIDDGVDATDGFGANNFYRVYITQASIGAGWQAVEEYRTGGGGVTTNTAALEVPTSQFIGIGILTYGTRWSSWNAAPFLFAEGGGYNTYAYGFAVPATFTPARVGLYWVGSAVDGNRVGLYDWYDEATR